MGFCAEPGTEAASKELFSESCLRGVGEGIAGKVHNGTEMVEWRSECFVTGFEVLCGMGPIGIIDRISNQVDGLRTEYQQHAFSTPE